MDEIMKTLAETEAPDITLKVRVAQIRQLYRQTWAGLVGILVINLAICVALWDVIAQWKLLAWAGFSAIVVIARAFVSIAFQRKAPTGEDINWWARMHVITVSISGLVWALPPVFLWPSDSHVHQLVWPICIVAVSASAVAMYCTWTPSYASHLILSVVPVSLRLLSEDGLIYTILGSLGLFFSLILAQTGRVMHAATLQAFVMSVRNEALSLFLAEEKAREQELNRKLQKAHDQLNQLSMTDELTGLWNRRFLNATIQKDISRVIRHYHNIHKGLENRITANIDIVFLMIDIDRFKVINDTYGHAAGDKTLIQMRQILTNHSRKTDTIIRWGGEEFMVVARNSCRNDYSALAENIMRAVERHPFDIGMEEPLRLTCSIGAAVFPFFPDWPEALSWDRVVELADTCLYASKRSGRNAWVGITPTSLATVADFMPSISKPLPELIQEGKLEMRTSLPENTVVYWSD